FCDGQDVFIAGSVHDENDMKLVTELANRHPDTKFILVPHEITPSAVQSLEAMLRGRTAVYSRVTSADNIGEAQVLIVDIMGSLAYIYRYARWAYVGGGFTRYLHSLIEATVYGLPVAFGPEIHRKITPEEISRRGVGRIVSTADELDAWFSSLKDNPARMTEISSKARAYVAENAGATDEIVDKILSSLSANS
ncbi:MAG: 3-deoxy-D-manno-octulosonic acid transferase, partial [Muribaculaceae bacterium]|nr:3-deoxy-D-manno-octulosonic acid transferase [Muribaculaceae bacterium]